MKSRKFRKMNKNKSRKNRMTYKKRIYKKINRTRKGGMFGIPKLFGFRGNKVQPEELRRSSRIEEQKRKREEIVNKSRGLALHDDDLTQQSTPVQASQQPPTMSQSVQNIIRPFLSWFGFFESEPSDTQNDIKLCQSYESPERNNRNGTNCTTPDVNCVVEVKNSPSTGDVVVGATIIYFSNIIVNYLNTKIRKNQIKPGNTFLKEYNSSNQVNQSNYYDAFLNYLQNVKGFRINGNDGINILDKYFDESAFNNTNSITTFNRNDFFNFVREILPETAANAFELKKLRIDYTGKALARITKLLVENSGEKYISYFTDNNVDQDNGTLCDSVENSWVLTCIRSRNNNYISIKEDGEWRLHYKNDDDILLNLKNKDEINGRNWNGYDLKKKPCGTCWICRQSIYHYYIIPKNTTDTDQIIYLNSKCGEDEHIFPPTVGDIIGTLNMDAKIVENVITEYGTETLLAYGLRPSHAFCNQLKSDFLFIALLNMNTGEDKVGEYDETLTFNEKYINKKWYEIVQKWFSQPRYNSFENIKQLFHDIPKEYYNRTLININNYLNDDIVRCFIKQTELSKINVSNMLKLKILIYIIQIGKNIIGEQFLQIWNKNMINE
uniref:Uncharacterized protein n=1 Tax=viral metagenome TaxID=1070528 RepID=A0A6C0H9H2_9ZZZZ